MKHCINKSYLLLVLFIVGVSVAACTRRDLDISQTEVDLHFDWSLLAPGDTLPKNMKLYFYADDGSIIEKEVTNEGYKGILPTGVYRVLTHNPDAQQVDYKKMNSYSEASVYVPELTKAIYLHQPSYSYGIGLNEFTVLPSKNNEATMKPVPFVKKTTIKLSLTGTVAAVGSCSCSLSGIAQAMRIAGAEPEDTEGIIEFTPLPITNGYESTISFFGRTKSSINMLGVVLYFKAGGSQVLSVDITSALSKVDIYNPWIEIKLNIEVTGSAEGVFQATLKDWIVENKEIIVI